MRDDPLKAMMTSSPTFLHHHIQHLAVKVAFDGYVVKTAISGGLAIMTDLLRGFLNLI